MLISKTAKVRITMKNKDYYINKGYEINTYYDKDHHERVKNNTYIDVSIKDLPLNSNAIVEIQCDYCKEVILKKYRDYIRQLTNSVVPKDSCFNCKSQKTNENYNKKYGTTSKTKLSKILNYKGGRKTKYKLEDVKQILEEHNLELSNDYVFPDNFLCTNKFPVICKNHSENGIQHRTLDAIIHSKYCCIYGRYDSQKGENNCNWNNGSTSNTEKIRKSIKYKNWRNSVFKRDNYTCQCCGDNRGNNLQAHHLYNFAEYEDLRFNVNNGITLCNKCHDFNQISSFHNIYGSRNNTPEQLQEYIKNYKLNLENQDSLLLCSNE